MNCIKYSILLVFTVLLSSCNGKRTNDDVFSEFEGEKGVYMVKLPPRLFMTLIGMEEDRINDDNIGDIDLVKMLVYSRENNTDEDTGRMMQRISARMNDFEYENIIGFTSSDVYVSAYILDNDQYVSDLMILFKEDQSLVCMGLSGKLDGRKIFKFASNLEYDKLRDFID